MDKTILHRVQCTSLLKVTDLKSTFRAIWSKIRREGWERPFNLEKTSFEMVDFVVVHQRDDGGAARKIKNYFPSD